MYNNFYGIVNYNHYFGNRTYDNSAFATTDISEDALWLGGGYRANLGGSVYTTIGIRYNVLQGNNSIFGDSAWQPVVGISAGF